MAQRPNILLVHCHDLGQFLGCYGVPTVQTPNLDAFAAQGVRFTRYFCTAPQCSPSRASIFTGRYPHNNGMMGLCHSHFGWDLHPGERHLGKILQDSGYYTAGVGVIHETHGGPFRCGLREYDPRSLAADAAGAALEMLAKRAANPDQPFYLQVGFAEPHRLPSPGQTDRVGFLGAHLQPDAEHGVTVPGYLRDTHGTRAELAELQGALKHVDTQFARVLGGVRQNGLEQNTLVIFTTDHGVALPRAKCSLYDPGLKTALLMRLPSRPGWYGGRVLEPLLSNIDLLPSLLDLAGAPVPESVQGCSFAPLLDGSSYTPRNAVFSEITYHDYYDPRRSVRTERYKLILNFASAYSFMDPSQSWRPRSDTATPAAPALAYHPPVELYDLQSDPWEQHDVAEEPAYAAVRAALLAQLRRHLQETADPILEGAVTSPLHQKAVGMLLSADTASE